MKTNRLKDRIGDLINSFITHNKYQKTESGMTNDSYVFEYNNDKYIIRIPGKGTNKIINRANEYTTYMKIKDLGICDEIECFSADSGIKISKFIDNAHNCDPKNYDEVKKCILKLKGFHNYELKTNYEFDLFKQIKNYESKTDVHSINKIYKNYSQTKEKVKSLEQFINSFSINKILCHIDPVCDNFLVSNDNDNVYLLDWEYAAMQDPHLDIAMFCIYSNYSREEIDKVIDIYFDNNCEEKVRYKIYAYVAISGFLWSVWCVYKMDNGSKLKKYAKTQYKYAIDYSKIVEDYINA